MQKDFIFTHKDHKNKPMFITCIGDWDKGRSKFVEYYILSYNENTKKIERRDGFMANKTAEDFIVDAFK